MAQHSSSEEKKAMERGAKGVAVLLSSWAKVLHLLGPTTSSSEIVITAGWLPRDSRVRPRPSFLYNLSTWAPGTILETPWLSKLKGTFSPSMVAVTLVQRQYSTAKRQETQIGGVRKPFNDNRENPTASYEIVATATWLGKLSGKASNMCVDSA